MSIGNASWYPRSHNCIGRHTITKKDRDIVNENIRANEVLLIDETGAKLGVKSREFALTMAEGKELDLVAVDPNADPPVCKLMDYGRFKFKQEKQRQKARKTQHTTRIRELRMKAKIEENDLRVKVRKMKEFLEKQDKVRINLFFRGREKVHLEEYKEKVFGRLMELTEDIAVVEEPPVFENNRYTIMFAPKKI